MTARQYEHIGRAVELVSMLNTASRQMDEWRECLVKELNAIRPDIQAKKWVTDRYGQVMAEWHIPRDFFDAVVSIIVAEKQEQRKGVRT